jgi:hypothetical protein
LGSKKNSIGVFKNVVGQPSSRLCILSGDQLIEQLNNSVQHVYEVRPCKDKRGFDLISDVLPFGGL